MNLIIPMAGMGKRMRPHTLTIPKPLIRIAGKPIVQRIVENISYLTDQPFKEISFVIGDFEKEIEDSLLQIAKEAGSKGRIFHQHEPLGTAHAVYCAAESLEGPVIIAFADTLFRSSVKLDQTKDGLIWVHEVENPSSFGVIVTDQSGVIKQFIEKPLEFISDQAIIGIYYFKDGGVIKKELEYLIDNHIVRNKEYQLTDALQNLIRKDFRFYTESVEEWLDCGNKDATVYTNQRILEFENRDKLVSKNAVINNSVIIKPCFIGDDVVIQDSVIGPYVSIGENTKINSSIIRNSIIQTNSDIFQENIDNSMIGNFVSLKGKNKDISVGDFTQIL